MPERQPTAEQWAAIRVDGSAAVRAGAGSGKTTVLAHRFLHLLRPGAAGTPPVETVGEILAITFTEKAASEMKRKIRELLAVELAGAPAGERPRWERVRGELLGAQISTIHAFCARVVRENPLEAGIDPRAAILDEIESRAYVETAVEEELTKRLRAGDAGAVELVQRHGLRGPRAAVGICVRFLDWLGRMGRDAAWLSAAMARQEARVPDAATALRAAAARIAAAVRARLAAPGSETKPRARLRAIWPEWEVRLARVDATTPLADVAGLRELYDHVVKAGFREEIAPDLRLVHPRLAGVLIDEHGFLASLPAARRLADLVAEVWQAVQRRKRADAVLTFDDLVAEARDLLAGAPAVRARYTERFRAVLVDEFQDTDAVQAAVIAELAGEGRSLFVVGDEKQSIYGFRGADVAVFLATRARLGRELPLGTNFRSQPAILAFVNALAAATLRVPPDSVDRAHWTVFDAGQRLVPDREQTWSGPGVRLVTFAGVHAGREDLDAAGAREIEGRVLAGVIAELHADPVRPVAYKDVAVLFRALEQVKAYEYALRRSRIPYYVVKGRGFFHCQEVRDVLSLLAAVTDPSDGIALAAVLRSPFFAVDDDTLWRLASYPDAAAPSLTRRFRAGERFADLGEQAPRLTRIRDLLRRLRRLRSRATIAELLEEALAATDFEAVCLTQFQGGQKVANVRKLIELGRDAERRRFVTLRDFVRAMRELTEREPREAEAQLVGEQDDVVRLMTIHQAKGLEFPVVVLVDLGRRMPAENDTAVLDEELGVLLAPTMGAGQQTLRQARLEEHRARLKDRARAESARLLYVACTRARDHLILLEGRGEGPYLRDGKGDRYVWCHQVWDLLGRERVSEFVASGTDSATLALADGTVGIERAEPYLARAAGEGAAERRPREAPPTERERAQVARVLGFRRPAPAEVVASPTALADFRRCPRQYWYRHVLGLPERGSGGRRARLLGTAAHAVLEAVDVTSRAVDEEAARRLADRPEAIGLRRAELDALGRDLGAAARALAADVAAGLRIVGREVPFVLPLPARAPSVFVEGRMDLVAMRGDRHVLRDYKYATASGTATAQHAAQLAPYRLALLAAGAVAVDAELVFLRGGTRVEPLPPLDAAAEEAALVQAGTGLGAATAAGGAAAFPRTPPESDVCVALGCGYVARCWGAALTRRAEGLPTCTAAS